MRSKTASAKLSDRMLIPVLNMRQLNDQRRPLALSTASIDADETIKMSGQKSEIEDSISIYIWDVLRRCCWPCAWRYPRRLRGTSGPPDTDHLMMKDFRSMYFNVWIINAFCVIPLGLQVSLTELPSETIISASLFPLASVGGSIWGGTTTRR